MVHGFAQVHYQAIPSGESKELVDILSDLEPRQHKGSVTAHLPVRSAPPARVRQISVGDPEGGSMTPRGNGGDRGGFPPCF